MTVSVLAPGLLGGSILKTLRKKNPALTLKAWARREETRLALSDAKLADEVCATPAAAVADSDLVILCPPVPAMAELAQQMLPALKRDALVTDVGSVKAPVHAALSPLLLNKARWTGSHPMAGSEQSGLEAARDDLFENAVTIITPAPDAEAHTVAGLRAFWESLGSRTLTLTPEEHDAHVAQISHLPHLLATLLVNTVSAESLRVAGPGFRDTTRVAAGPPELWVDILKANHQAILSALVKLQSEIQSAREILEGGDGIKLLELLAAANQKRRGLF
ncbi:MAG: prephenate dehydrogenase/arogenate dehydrogenase family protein [Verrucomicrobiales bacterium]|jgi:prephenate dehydrogenase|nr:prephenate dehydrogenase/arogenate dehydrogenase family protein [Verrucomicrobiales bacterium]